jgi:hypothetical protein
MLPPGATQVRIEILIAPAKYAIADCITDLFEQSWELFKNTRRHDHGGSENLCLRHDL